MTLTDVDGHAVRKTGKTQRGTNIFGIAGGYLRYVWVD